MSSCEGTAVIFNKVPELFAEICKQCNEANSTGSVNIRDSIEIQEGLVEQIYTVFQIASAHTTRILQIHNCLSKPFCGGYSPDSPWCKELNSRRSGIWV
jgi:hypothetical protein